jgi:hypothetical protein
MLNLMPETTLHPYRLNITPDATRAKYASLDGKRDRIPRAKRGKTPGITQGTTRGRTPGKQEIAEACQRRRIWETTLYMVEHSFDFPSRDGTSLLAGGCVRVEI